MPYFQPAKINNAEKLASGNEISEIKNSVFKAVM